MNQNNPQAPESNNPGMGLRHPPRNPATAKPLTMSILAYSLKKKMAQRKPEYSVIQPATNSDSASGISKGVRFVSAMTLIKKMKKAADFLLGEHDFSAFRGNLCQAKSPIKTLESIEIIKTDDTILIKIKANAFLHHMVRNIVGTLLKIGRDEREINWMLSVLQSKDRKQAGPTAEPQGLYFVKAYYHDF
mgnify:CR=1 FL=1